MAGLPNLQYYIWKKGFYFFILLAHLINLVNRIVSFSINLICINIFKFLLIFRPSTTHQNATTSNPVPHFPSRTLPPSNPAPCPAGRPASQPRPHRRLGRPHFPVTWQRAGRKRNARPTFGISISRPSPSSPFSFRSSSCPVKLYGGPRIHRSWSVVFG